MTNQSSIQEVLFFPQMKPEKQAPVSSAKDFEAIGIPEAWSSYFLDQYGTVDAMKDLKHTQVHQQMNGLRKKKKLDLPALQLEEVLSWMG